MRTLGFPMTEMTRDDARWPRFVWALAVFLTLSIAANAQGVRYDPPPILGQNGLPLHNVGVTLCPGTATIMGTTCSPQTPSFTDITLGTQCASGLPVTLPGSSFCQANSDAFGNAGFWLSPGAYIYCLNGPGIRGTCYNVTVPVGSTVSGAATVGSSTVTNYKRDCRVDGTLDTTGATDSSAIINTCIANAVTNTQSTIYLPCGKLLINTPVNMTNRPGLHLKGCSSQFQISSQSAIASIGVTRLLCNSGTACIDMTGSGESSLEDLILILAGTGITTPTPIGILEGRDNNGGGGGGNPFCFAENQNFHRVMVIDFTSGGLNTTANGNRGYIGVYNNGAEQVHYSDFGIFTATPMVFTANNVASVSSPYQTLSSGCTVTMTAIHLDNGTLSSNSSVTQPNVEADGTANSDVLNTTFIGGSCAMKFEGALGGGGSALATKWHVVANQESTNATSSFICTSVNLQDSFFHLESDGQTAHINPTANNLVFRNDIFDINTDLGFPLFTNTSAGTSVQGGYLTVNSTASESNVTVTGAHVNAPGLTSTQLAAVFNSASAYFYDSSTGAGALGTLRTTIIQQDLPTVAWQLLDNAANTHIFISSSSPYLNTFISGNGSGNTLIGGSAKLGVADTTGQVNQYGGISTGGTGVAPNYGTPINLTGQVANLGATTIYTTAASGNGTAGLYRVCAAAWTTTTGNSTVTINAIAPNGAGTVTAPLPQTLNTAAVTNPGGGCTVLGVAASSAIQVSVTGYNTTGTYSIKATVEQLM